MLLFRHALPIGLALLGCFLEKGATHAGQDDPHASWRESLVPDGRPQRLENVEGLSCAECHATITEEWRHSTHAIAWVDPHFNKELKRIRRKQGCTGCHAPEPLAGKHPGASPRTRKEDPHLGVDCRTCHLAADGETILGPKGLDTEAHPTEAHEWFDHEATSELCISCHDVTIGPVIGVAKDWKASDLAEDGESCVSCHMPSIRRPWAELDGEPTETRRGRSHRIEGPRDPGFLREAMHLEAEFSEEGASVRVTNLTGHRVPGLIGREIQLAVRGLDASGRIVARAEATLDHRTYLPLERPLTIELESSLIATVRVEGSHKAPGIPKAQVFLEREYTR